jgi:hypothetical protein
VTETLFLNGTGADAGALIAFGVGNVAIADCVVDGNAGGAAGAFLFDTVPAASLWRVTFSNNFESGAGRLLRTYKLPFWLTVWVCSVCSLVSARHIEVRIFPRESGPAAITRCTYGTQ